MKPMKKDKGFTIVELVIVIAVVAILSAVLIPTFTGLIDSAKRSTDEQLVAQVNHMLIADQSHFDFNNASSPANIKNKIEKEYGVTLETKSKDVYIFYNNITHLLELGSITEEGNYIKVYPENEQKTIELGVPNQQALLYASPMLMANAVAAEESGDTQKIVKPLTTLSSPEGLFEDYFLIASNSSDKFAKAINLLRNPSSENDILEAVKLIEGNKKMAPVIKSLLRDLVENTAFVIQNDTNATKVLNVTISGQGKNAEVNLVDKPVRNVIFAQNVDNISTQLLNDIQKAIPQIMEIPESIKTITMDDNFGTAFQNLTSTTIVIANEAFKNALAKENVSEDIVNGVVDETKRSESIKKIKVMKKTGNTVGDVVASAEVIKDSFIINGSSLMLGVPEGSKAIKFAGLKFTTDGQLLAADQMQKQTVGNKIYNKFQFSIEELGLQPTEDGSYVIYAEYADDTATARVGNQYFTLNDALDYAAGNGYSDEIFVLGTAGTITRETIVDINDILRLPKDADDDFAYDDFVDSLNQDRPWYTKELASTHNKFSDLKVNDDLHIYGKVFTGAMRYCASGGSANTSSAISKDYGQITLGDAGHIYVENGGTVTNYGKIIGSNTSPQVTVRNGGRINGMVTTNSFNGGTYTTSIASTVFPFGTYSMDGLFVNTTFEYGSVFNGQLLFATRFGKSGACINLVGPNDKGSYMFKMYEGSTVTYNDDGNRTKVIINKGIVDVDKVEIKVSSVGIDTGTVVLPIASTYDIIIASGSTLNITTNNNKEPTGIKMMPGSKMTVEKDGILKISNSALYVYEWANDFATYAPSLDEALQKNDELIQKFNNKKSTFITNVIGENTQTINGCYSWYDGSGKGLLPGRFGNDDAELVIDGQLIFAGEKCGFNGNIQTTDKSKNPEDVIVYNGNEQGVDFSYTMKESVFEKTNSCGDAEFDIITVSATKTGKSAFNGVEIKK